MNNIANIDKELDSNVIEDNNKQKCIFSILEPNNLNKKFNDDIDENILIAIISKINNISKKHIKKLLGKITGSFIENNMIYIKLINNNYTNSNSDNILCTSSITYKTYNLDYIIKEINNTLVHNKKIKTIHDIELCTFCLSNFNEVICNSCDNYIGCYPCFVKYLEKEKKIYDRTYDSSIKQRPHSRCILCRYNFKKTDIIKIRRDLNMKKKTILAERVHKLLYNNNYNNNNNYHINEWYTVYNNYNHNNNNNSPINYILAPILQ